MKLMRWTLVGEMNGMDFGIRMQQRWSGGKINTTEVEYTHKQDGGTR